MLIQDLDQCIDALRHPTSGDLRRSEDNPWWSHGNHRNPMVGNIKGGGSYRLLNHEHLIIWLLKILLPWTWSQEENRPADVEKVWKSVIAPALQQRQHINHQKGSNNRDATCKSRMISLCEAVAGEYGIAIKQPRDPCSLWTIEFPQKITRLAQRSSWSWIILMILNYLASDLEPEQICGLSHWHLVRQKMKVQRIQIRQFQDE